MENRETSKTLKNDNDSENPAEIKEKLSESTTTTTAGPSIPANTIIVSNALTNVVKIKPITTATVTKIIPATTLAKIAPKPSTSIVKQTSSNGKLVLIQSPGGTSQTIRIAGTASTATSSPESGTSTTATGIRLIKMSDGNLYQVKNKSLLSPTNTTTTTLTDKKPTQQHIGRVIVKGGVPQRIILSSQTSIANSTTTTTTSSAPLPRTYTVAQAQQLGLLSASKIKELVSAATTSSMAKKTLTPILPSSSSTIAASATSLVQIHSTAVSTTVSAATNTSSTLTSTPVTTTFAAVSIPTTSTSCTTNKTLTAATTSTASTSSLLATDKLKQTIVLNQQQQQQSVIPAQKIIIKSAGGIQKQMTLPQNIVKLAQGGQIRAVNVAGRGIQYVRVINSTTAAANPQATTTSGIVTQAKSSDANKLIATASGASKLFVQSTSGGGKQTYTLVSSSSSSLNNDDSKLVKSIVTNVPATATQVKPIITFTTHPTLVPIKKSQNIVSKVAGPSVPIVANKEVAENEEKLKQFLQINQSKSGGNNSRVSSTPFSYSSMTNALKQQIEAENIKREKFASEITMVAKQKLQTEIKNADSLVSMELLPIKSDEDENSASSNDNIQIIEKSPTSSIIDDAVSGPRRKHCNCTKSQCLKLYCDCFANGEFCFNCTCKECFNNLENETERFNAIKACLERNPHAFKPKIGKAKDNTDSTLRRHNKGCNCKRSGCLKNYCECYEAKICCSANCKCVGCRNVIEIFNEQLEIIESVQKPIIKTEIESQQTFANRKRSMEQQIELPSLPTISSAKPSAVKKPCNFMTQDVIEATVQCIISQADDCQQQNMDKTTSEKMILEEFGRCLVEIIEFSLKNNDN